MRSRSNTTPSALCANQNRMIAENKRSMVRLCSISYMERYSQKLYFRVVLFTMLATFVTGNCSDLDLGMERKVIPDSSVTASSEESPAKNGRLKGNESWCASTSDTTQHLQIDLQMIHIICAVATQGNPQAQEWVETYSLQFSKDGASWIDYTELGQVKNFTGNNDSDTEIKNVIHGVLAEKLRFVSRSSHSRSCLRAEIYGVRRNPENLAFGKNTAQSSNYSTGFSSKAVDGNADTDYNNGHCSHTMNDDPSWWWVDLASDHVPVSEVLIVNSFSSHSQDRNEDYQITLGDRVIVTNNPACDGRYSFIQFIASAVCYRNPLTTGRYLGIKTTKKQILQLCEVEVYSRENLAYNKQTQQSSEHSSARRAVDGNSNPNWRGNSCTHTQKEDYPWWMVDLGQEEPVNEVYVVNRDVLGWRLNPFEIRVGANGITGGTSNPKCGDGYSVDQGKGASFFCCRIVYGRFVTIRNTASSGRPLTLCEVEVYSARRACSLQALGVVSRYAFPDDRFSASSSATGKEASKGRLHGNSAWSPSSDNNGSDYLQIDLEDEFFICAVATQGSANSDHWTTTYKVLLSLNKEHWVTYKENGADKIFNANVGRYDIVKHSLVEIARARFFRFQPIHFKTRKALRVEVYGVVKPSAPSKAPESFAVTSRTSTSIAASWQLPPVGSRHGGITGYKLLYRRRNPAGSNITTVNIKSGATLTKTVSELEKYTEYEFQLLAVNGAGDGPKGLVKVARTKEDVPSRAPASVNVAAVSSTGMKAKWQLPPSDFRHGIIKGFKLFYRKKTPSDSQTFKIVINDAASLSKTVTKLEIYTEYQFQVLAFTTVGDGPNSSVVINRTMEDAPSQAPSSLNVAAASSTSITANWRLPPADSHNGVITGFKLFYKKKSPSDSRTVMLLINDGAAVSQMVTGLNIYTEYQFQVLAFTSAGDGPNSSVEIERTMEDAPSVPYLFSHILIGPSESHGPRINLTWSRPEQENGRIRSYTLFYKHREDPQNVHTKTFGADTFSALVNVLGGFNYQFHVRAVTIKPGGNASLPVLTPEYAPSVGPDNVDTYQLNKTTFNISWAPIPRNRSYGHVKQYEVKGKLVFKGARKRRAVGSDKIVNSSDTFAIFYDMELCSKYNLSVRAYTSAGPGPYSRDLQLQTTKPDDPVGLEATNIGKTEVTLKWKQPNTVPDGGLRYKVEYIGTKDYNTSFSDTRSQDTERQTEYTVKNLVPGTQYTFEVYGISQCGESSPVRAQKHTKISDPVAPYVGKITDEKVSGSSALIYLWPAEQRNGPISAYQIIVLKVVDGVENLPTDYASKLKDSASKSKLNFYIATELSYNPVRNTSWQFTVGDGKKYGVYVNRALEGGTEYIVYQRAISRSESGTLEGNSTKVAKISVAKPKDTGSDATKNDDGGFDVTAVIVPVVLLLLLIPAIVIGLLFYRRRKWSQRESGKKSSISLDDIAGDEQQATSSTSNLVYQNVADMKPQVTAENQIYQNLNGTPETEPDKQIYQNSKNRTAEQPANKVYQNVADMRRSKEDEKGNQVEVKEPLYSEAQDGKPKPIPASEFVTYFRSKSINGAAVLRQEFKDLPGGMLSTWETAKSNKGKNRYGNIVTYDHSRVVLEKLEGDTNSDYINASYIPTYDNKTISYIATQGPNKITISDFWRMIWQENCYNIVMLTNTVEQGKVKCDQYWPDDASKYGAIKVTLQQTAFFADYVIRTLILVKDSEKREILQFHYTTWPDRGVPHHSAALLAFRWKVHVNHEMTGGPLVVHCSAGVGRTGTYIGIDAMLESAKMQKSIFISNYVHVMRKCRPHMVQKDEQYVFLHQAVMVALVCGNTEVAPHDLLIRMNKLARAHKTSTKTGYAEEYKRLKLISESEGSEDEKKEAFMPANINKNRFPNIIPLDSARPFLRSSEPNKDYINASLVDDYVKRNAYILTQAPLDNTIDDFWRMVSQYKVGTVVMLNNLREGQEVYSQYWPSSGSVKYGTMTLEMLSESTVTDKLTTRKFSVSDAQPPKKNSTVHHLHFTGWSDPNTCPDPKEILQLLTNLQTSQQQTGNGIIVFQCSDGMGRSGVVATIMSAIERVKNEQSVDVLQTVNLIRVKRPNAVASVKQYVFCYKTIQAYLDSFEAYANFSQC